MLSSAQLKKIEAEARPIIERQIDDAAKLAGLRDVVAAAGGDWGQLKALIKAQIKDENDEAGDGKHVRKILDKADYATAYADMLGLANMNEKNSFAGIEELDPHLLNMLVQGSQSEAGRSIIYAALQAVQDGETDFQPSTGEIIETNSTPDSPIGEEAGEAETGETLSASPANHQAETPNQSTDASQERAQTATGVGTSGDNLGSSSRSSATAKTGVPTDQSQAPGDGQSQHNSDVRVASVDAPISQPVSEAPSLAAADRSGGHLAPSSSLQAVSAPVATDRTKHNPDCRDPSECGVEGSWDYFRLACQRAKREREAMKVAAE